MYVVLIWVWTQTVLAGKKRERKWCWLLVQVGNLLPDERGSSWEEVMVKGKGGDGPSPL